jgi:hypothetical protein
LTHAGIIPALRWLKANPEKVAVVRNLPTLNSIFVLKHKGGIHSRKVHVAFFGPQPKETNPDGTFKKVEFTSRVSMTEEELVKMWGQCEMPFRFLQRHLATWGIRMLEVGTFVGPHYQPKIVLATSAKIETDSLRWHRLDQLPFEVNPAADIDGAITGLPIWEAEATGENLRVLKDELHGEIQLQAPVKPGSASSSAPHKGKKFEKTSKDDEIQSLKTRLQLLEALVAKDSKPSESEIRELERRLLKKQSKK